VRGTLVRQGVPKRKAGGQGWKRNKPKTKSSNRDIPVSTTTMQELRRWRKQQATERLQIGPEWQDHDFVFTTETGTPLGNNMGRAWERVMAMADGGQGDLGTWGAEPEKPASGPTAKRSFTPRYPLYVLRHTSATLALLDSVPLLTVSRRLGHKNISITARFYGHVQAEHSGAAAESFNRLAASV
jgi:integrase